MSWPFSVWNSPLCPSYVMWYFLLHRFRVFLFDFGFQQFDNSGFLSVCCVLDLISFLNLLKTLVLFSNLGSFEPRNLQKPVALPLFFSCRHPMRYKPFCCPVATRSVLFVFQSFPPAFPCTWFLLIYQRLHWLFALVNVLLLLSWSSALDSSVCLFFTASTALVTGSILSFMTVYNYFYKICISLYQNLWTSVPYNFQNLLISYTDWVIHPCSAEFITYLSSTIMR